MVTDSLPKPFFVLAPMDDVTDTVLRQIVAGLAPPDLFFTEFVNVDGLQSVGRSKLLPKVRFTPDDRPLIAQLWGKNPENFYKTAVQIADGTFARELGLPDGVNFAGIDLNMGCPAKAEVKNGTCSALMLPDNRGLAQEIITATREGMHSVTNSLLFSVKTRLGFNQIDYSWHEFLLQQKLNMLTIHGRTKKQMSKVPAEWDKIGEVRAIRDRVSPTTLIVGNGDVTSRQHGESLAQQYGLDGIMIGRGLFHDPFVFAKRSPWETYTRQQRIELYKQHVDLFGATWTQDERKIHTLNKFCKIYIQNFDGAKELREIFMAADSVDELAGMIDQALHE